MASTSDSNHNNSGWHCTSAIISSSCCCCPIVGYSFGLQGGLFFLHMDLSCPLQLAAQRLIFEGNPFRILQYVSIAANQAENLEVASRPIRTEPWQAVDVPTALVVVRQGLIPKERQLCEICQQVDREECIEEASPRARSQYSTAMRKYRDNDWTTRANVFFDMAMRPLA